MREFYIFEIKENVLKNYKYNYEELYNLIERIHYLRDEDLVLGFSIFNSLVIPINKDEYNEYIKRQNLDSENYICYNYTHTINDFYFSESTKMTINNTHIKIKTNKNIPSFFYNLKNFKNLFVCDFENKDYFVLEESFYTSCINA